MQEGILNLISCLSPNDTTTRELFNLYLFLIFSLILLTKTERGKLDLDISVMLSTVLRGLDLRVVSTRGNIAFIAKKRFILGLLSKTSERVTLLKLVHIQIPKSHIYFSSWKI